MHSNRIAYSWKEQSLAFTLICHVNTVFVNPTGYNDNFEVKTGCMTQTKSPSTMVSDSRSLELWETNMCFLQSMLSAPMDKNLHKHRCSIPPDSVWFLWKILILDKILVLQVIWAISYRGCYEVKNPVSLFSKDWQTSAPR